MPGIPSNEVGMIGFVYAKQNAVGNGLSSIGQRHLKKMQFPELTGRSGDQLIAITTATATGTTAAAATATGFHGLGFGDREVTSVNGLAAEGINRGLSVLGAAHGDESKATRALGFTIHDQVRLNNGAVLGEKFGQVLFGGLEGKVSYV